MGALTEMPDRFFMNEQAVCTPLAVALLTMRNARWKYEDAASFDSQPITIDDDGNIAGFDKDDLDEVVSVEPNWPAAGTR